jgi:hypothetical protein
MMLDDMLPDAEAVLDVNINANRSFVIADTLRQRGIPFVFVTGCSLQGMAPPVSTRHTPLRRFRRSL